MAKFTKESVDRFYDFDIFVETRTLYMGSVSYNEGESGTDFNMAERIIKGLHVLENASLDKPITIIMNNIGGDPDHGMAIYDAIRLSPCHITIKAMGNAQSMGSIILQAADHRAMSPNTAFMIHYGGFAMHGHAKDVYAQVEKNKTIDKLMIDIFIEKIKEKDPSFARKKLEDMVNFDKYFSADRALELGLIDEILHFPTKTS